MGHLLFVTFCIFCFFQAITNQIFRSSCRRDVLVKAADKEAKLLGSSGNVIEESKEDSLPKCIRRCLAKNSCLSLNYKKTLVQGIANNCEILSIAKSSTGVSVVSNTGWIHYEPLSQIGPRCRNLICSPGFRCEEVCSNANGYECADINECLSNPCLNGGTCSNEVNKFSCACPPFFATPVCESHLTGCTYKETAYDSTDRGYVPYIDRHTASCGGSDVMTRWVIDRSGSKIRYRYRCCEFKSGFCSVSTKYGNFQESGNGDLHYIDRLYVDCGLKGYVNFFKVETSGDQVRTVYKCCTVNIQSWESSVTCYDAATNWKPDHDRLYELSNHNVQCNSNYGLSYFRFQFDSSMLNAKVNFRCCKLLP